MDVIKSLELLIKLNLSLHLEINRISSKYLDQHLGDLSLNTLEWEHDVKAFVLLTHAVIENYIEVLSGILIENAHFEFKYNGKTTEVLLMFCWTNMRESPSFNDKDWDDSTRILFISSFEEAKVKYVNYLNNDNHGVKYKHLNKVLRAVGLDLPQSSKNVESLMDLAEHRGKFAHRFLERGNGIARVSRFENPDKINTIVSGSKSLMDQLHWRALKKLSLTSDNKIHLQASLINCLKAYKTKLESNEKSLF